MKNKHRPRSPRRAAAPVPVAAAAAGTSAAALSSPPAPVAADLRRASRHLKEGRLVPAEALCRRTLDRDPRQPEALALMGTIASRQGQHENAVVYGRAAVRERPDEPAFHFHLGAALAASGKPSEAEAAFAEAIRLDPDAVEARNHLAALLFEERRFADAADGYRALLRLVPDAAEVYSNLGLCLRALEDLEGAVEALLHALRLNPRHANAHCNLGIVRGLQGRHEEAIACQRRALKLSPDNAAMRTNLGLALMANGELAEATTWLEEAVRIDPRLYAAHFNLALMLLSEGDLDRGWQEYEWGFSSESRPLRPFPYPDWDGGCLSGRTLLVYAEQGLGDEILFASAFPDLLARAEREGGAVVIECAPRLQTLFARSFPGARVVGAERADHSWLAGVGAIDAKVAIGSLPRFFRPTLDSFPEQSRYLVPDACRVAALRARLDASDSASASAGSGGRALTLGFSWRSGLQNARRNRSYTRLEQWGPLFSLPGVRWVCLQYDECEGELAEAEARFGVPLLRLGELDLRQDLEGAAALTAVLDAVVTPNTSVFMMAGALAVPTWLLLAYEGMWGCLGTDRFPFFGSARAVRQPRPGAWQPVFERIAADLREKTR